MKTIRLVSLELRNFRSFTKETIIPFPPSGGMRLIVGENKVDPDLGANGAGKSSLFAAIRFCLYGDAAGNATGSPALRGNELVSHGAKDTAVTLRLDIDGTEHAITRTHPPERIYIDSEQAEQIEIDRLIGLSKARFLNSVMFGQAAPLFIDLTIPQRGELIDEVLDLSVWLSAADRAGKKLNEENELLNKLTQDRARLEGQLDALSDTANLKQQAKQWKIDQDLKIEECFNTVDQINKDLSFHEKESSRLGKLIDPKKVDELNTVVKRERAAWTDNRTQLSVAQEKLRAVEEHAAFYADNDKCPKCGQPIKEDLVETCLLEAEDQITALEKTIKSLKSEGDKIEERGKRAGDRHQAEFNTQSQFNRDLAESNLKLMSLKRDIDRLEKQAEALDVEKNPYTAQIDNLAGQKKLVETALKAMDDSIADAKTRAGQYDFWKQAFKHVRLFCVKRIVDQLEIETMNATAALGLVGWKIKYATETENKSGTMKSGIQIEVETPSRDGKFNSYSPGEGQRVRIAVALGLASLIQRYAGVRFLAEVWDEPSAWLSEAGIEDLLECFHRRAESLDKSLYIVDHRALTYSGFNEVWCVTKETDGSSITLLNRSET